jgi:hypothetical protein
MNDPHPPFDIRHNEPASRFEAIVNGHTSFAAYDRDDDVLRLNHTSVPASLEDAASRPRSCARRSTTPARTGSRSARVLVPRTYMKR